MKKQNKKKYNKRARQSYAITGRGYSSKEKISYTFLDPHKYIAAKYVQVFSQSIATNVGINQVMNLNSCFDPDRSGVGHQPYGWDQIAALYNRYRVLKCKWKVSFGASSDTYRWVIVPINGLLNASITNATTYEAACENPRAISGFQCFGAGEIVKRGTTALNNLNGVTRTEYLADDRYESLTTASPSEVMTLTIGLQNQTAATLIIPFTVEMIFETDLHDPLPLAQST